MRASAGVVALGLALFTWNLWGTDLWAPDEPYFGEGAREMIDDGHWAVPHVNGAITTDKPPLFFWTIALFSLPAGSVTPLTARLPSALAALGTLLLTLHLARRGDSPSGGAGGGRGWRVGVPLSGLILATTWLFIRQARSAQIDALLTLLITAALAAFAAWRRGSWSGRAAGLVFWLAVAGAVLAKGPVGLILPLGIAVITLLAAGEGKRWREFAPLAGPLLFVAVLGGWIAWASVAEAGYSVVGALREHALERVVGGMHHKQPPWYYLKVIPVHLLPWSGLIPGAIWLAWKRRGREIDRFHLIWAGFVIVFFTLSTEKRDLYILPALPPLSLLMARLLEADAEKTVSPAWTRLGLGGVAVGLLAAGLALPFAAQRIATLPWAVPAATGAGLALLGGLVLPPLLRRRQRPAAVVLGLGMAAFCLAANTFLVPRFNDVKSARSFALRLREETRTTRERGEDVVAFRLGNLPEAIAFHSRGVYTLETNDPEVLARHLLRPQRVHATVNEDHLPLLAPEARARVVTIERTVLSRMPVALIHNGGETGDHPRAAEGTPVPEPAR